MDRSSPVFDDELVDDDDDGDADGDADGDVEWDWVWLLHTDRRSSTNSGSIDGSGLSVPPNL